MFSVYRLILFKMGDSKAMANIRMVQGGHYVLSNLYLKHTLVMRPAMGNGTCSHDILLKHPKGLPLLSGRFSIVIIGSSLTFWLHTRNGCR